MNPREVLSAYFTEGQTKTSWISTFIGKNIQNHNLYPKIFMDEKVDINTGFRYNLSELQKQGEGRFV